MAGWILTLKLINLCTWHKMINNPNPLMIIWKKRQLGLFSFKGNKNFLWKKFLVCIKEEKNRAQIFNLFKLDTTIWISFLSLRVISYSQTDFWPQLSEPRPCLHNFDLGEMNDWKIFRFLFLLYYLFVFRDESIAKSVTIWFWSVSITNINAYLVKQLFYHAPLQTMLSLVGLSFSTRAALDWLYVYVLAPRALSESTAWAPQQLSSSA